MAEDSCSCRGSSPGTFSGIVTGPGKLSPILGKRTCSPRSSSAAAAEEGAVGALEEMGDLLQRTRSPADAGGFDFTEGKGFGKLPEVRENKR